MGDGRKKLGQVRGVVREVGVHYDHDLGAAVQRVLEAREVRAPQPTLALTVKHLHRGQRRGELVGNLPGPVRRGVVDDQQPMLAGRAALELALHRSGDPFDVSGLVERGDSDPDPRAVHDANPTAGRTKGAPR